MWSTVCVTAGVAVGKGVVKQVESGCGEVGCGSSWSAADGQARLGSKVGRASVEAGGLAGTGR